jgi:hypothetical protein
MLKAFGAQEALRGVYVPAQRLDPLDPQSSRQLMPRKICWLRIIVYHWDGCKFPL